MIVVTTPTGHIGSQVAQQLVEQGEKVRVVARDPKKLAPALAGKVEVVQGSIDDEATMLRALEGAESVFLVVPPDFACKDLDAYYLGLTRVAIRAMKARGCRRAVGVSALGKGYAGDAGVVGSSHRKDELFAEAGLDYRALWAPGFMENFLLHLESLKHGVFSWPMDGTLKTRHAATRDIATMGTKLLSDRTWKGQGGVGILGTEDQSLEELAVVLSDVLGRPIRFQRAASEAYKQQIMQYGGSEAMADGMIKMFDAKSAGMDELLPRTAENTTPTSFRVWAEEVLKPAFTGS